MCIIMMTLLECDLVGNVITMEAANIHTVCKTNPAKVIFSSTNPANVFFGVETPQNVLCGSMWEVIFWIDIFIIEEVGKSLCLIQYSTCTYIIHSIIQISHNNNNNKKTYLNNNLVTMNATLERFLL